METAILDNCKTVLGCVIIVTGGLGILCFCAWLGTYFITQTLHSLDCWVPGMTFIVNEIKRRRAAKRGARSGE